jgi:hypothetical protein
MITYAGRWIANDFALDDTAVRLHKTRANIGTNKQNLGQVSRGGGGGEASVRSSRA